MRLTGFEPAVYGLKAHCHTTWLQTHNYFGFWYLHFRFCFRFIIFISFLYIPIYLLSVCQINVAATLDTFLLLPAVPTVRRNICSKRKWAVMESNHPRPKPTDLQSVLLPLQYNCPYYLICNNNSQHPSAYYPFFLYLKILFYKHQRKMRPHTADSNRAFSYVFWIRDVQPYTYESNVSFPLPTTHTGLEPVLFFRDREVP